MLHQSGSSLEAIQVIRSEDKQDSIEDESQINRSKVKVIKTITQYKRKGPKLEDVLINQGFGNLPVLVFSITGKTRGGKSFLLNMMIKYLEWDVKSGGEWTTGKVPSGFEWKGGKDSVTRGLWIWPKIYERNASDGSKVGILLLDNEGMFDGEATDGEIIAISGISTGISYLQMFNLKEKITSDCLEGIVRNLVKGVEQIDDNAGDQLRDGGYRLMFVVRDWIGEEETYGLEEGAEYIKEEKERGTDEYRAMWRKVEETFSETECLLLPHPGTIASKKQFTDTGDLSKLEDEFMREVKCFIEKLFSPNRLTPPEVPLTGRAVFEILQSADNREADDSLSFLNVYTDHNNWIRAEKLREDFSQRLSMARFADLKEIQGLMIDILARAETSLSGQSKQEHLDKLKKTIHDLVNNKVIEIVMDKYRSSLSSSLSLHGKEWTYIKRKLQNYLCGETATFVQAQRKAVLKAATIYYEILSKTISDQLKMECKNMEKLELLMGLGERTMVKFTECRDFNFGADTKLINSAWLMQRQRLKDKVINIIFEKTGALTEIDVDDLKKSARSQYEYFEALNLLNNREWDEVEKEKQIILRKKVGYAMFGLPTPSTEIQNEAIAESSQNKTTTNTPLSDGENSTNQPILTNINSPLLFETTGPVGIMQQFKSAVSRVVSSINVKKVVLETGYSSEQEKKIKPVADKIVALSTHDDGKIKFSCVFLTFPQDDDKKVPLFRIQGVDGIKYLDTNCRLYNSWNDFKTTNTLADVVYCCPAHGNYNKKKEFFVDFLKSPASKFEAKALKCTDVASKGVAGVAGVAGVLALVTTAPVVGPVAVVGGGLAGLYGAVRGGFKIWDKYKHGQEVNKSDYIEVTLNTVSAASMGVGAAAVAVERLAVSATRFAQGLSFFGTAALFFGSGDVPSIDVLIAELADISLKVLFYFNSASSLEAIEVIKENLRLPSDTNSANVLVALVDKNAIESAVECDDGLIKKDKFVSSNVSNLVAQLLTTVSSELREVVFLVNDIDTIIQPMINEIAEGEKILNGTVRNEISQKMELLFGKLIAENEDLITRIISLLSKRDSADNCTEMTVLMNGLFDNDVELVLTARQVVWSMISQIRNANRFYNSVEHQPILLHGVEVECHPLEEVTRKIKALSEQAESTSNLSSEVISDIEAFLQQIYDLLLAIAEPNWRFEDFAKNLKQVLSKILDMFNSRLSEHKLYLEGNKEQDCDNLITFFKKNGIKGNFGGSLMQSVIEDYEHESNTIERGVAGLTIIEAWCGFIDHMFYFHSSLPDDILLGLLIEKLTNGNGKNYSNPSDSRYGTQSGTLYELIPCDRNLFKTFIIYSFKTKEGTHGLVWKEK